MELKRWFLIAAAIFGAGLVLGFLLPGNAAEEILDSFENLAGEAEGLSGFGMFLFLLFNNAVALSISFFFSPLFLIFPVVSLLMNGALITVVGRVFVEENSATALAAGILPHGIIEIPAYLLAQAAALSFGYAILRGLFLFLNVLRHN